MSGSPFESTTILYRVFKRASASGTSGNGVNLVHRVGDSGALEGVGDGAVSDLPVRRVLLVKQRVDHGVLEVRAPPPGHERVRSAAPSLAPQVGSDRLRQALLHVHDPCGTGRTCRP